MGTRILGANDYVASSLTAATLLRRCKRGERLACHEHVFLFLDEPGASPASAAFAVCMWASLLLYAALWSRRAERPSPLPEHWC